MNFSFPSLTSFGRLSPRDLVAGLWVAGLLLPEAVAYAGIAHLAVTHALVAMMVGLLVYAVLGGSRFAIVAPTSSAAAMASAAVLTAPEMTTNPLLYAQAMMALVLMAGSLFILLGFARQGQIAAFVSRPVLRGFAFALAVTIVIKQLPDALGITVPVASAQDPLHLLLNVVSQFAQWHWVAVTVAVSTAIGLAMLRLWKRIPSSMVVIVLAVVAARLLDLHAMGVAEVGHIDPPTFHMAWPDLSRPEWLRLGELAFGLVMILFAESWGSMRNLALTHGDSLNANRELIALGVCNVGAALLQGMPVGAGFSASSANASAGAQTRWAGLVALVMIAVTVTVALPALNLLPRAVLAVVVIHALLHALNPQPLIAIWRTRRDRLALVGAVIAVLALGVLHGMLVGIGLSLLSALKRFSQPIVHELGELQDTRDYIIVDGRPDLVMLPHLLILRPEEPLFFANADRVAAEIFARAQQKNQINVVVLSLEESSDLDSSALESLKELSLRLAKEDKKLVFSRVKDAVRTLFVQQDPDGLGHPQRMFWSVADAVAAYRIPD